MTPGLITIHCSATPNGKPYSIEAIRKFHTDPPPAGRGWREVGYHLVIQPDGQVDNGRSLTDQGAHVEGFNVVGGKVNLGICFIGTDLFTLAQFHAARYKIDSVCMGFSIPKWAIFGHHDFPSGIAQGKTCPNICMGPFMYWYLTQDEAAIRPYLIPVV